MTPDDLAIVLEYAYRGVSAQKGSCHRPDDREPGCPLCGALTAVEERLDIQQVEPEWWRISLWQRVRTMLR